MFSIQGWLSEANEPPDAAGRMDHYGVSTPMTRFSAMPKLLDESEIEKLAGEPGFEPQLQRKLRHERRRVFKLYLSELVTEFRVLEREALDRAANDSRVEAGFAESVLKIKFRFMASVWLLRASLWLPANVLPGTHQMAIDLVGSLNPLLSKPS